MSLHIVIASDQKLAWVLPWFYRNLRKHEPNIPVLFYDLGCKDEGLAAPAHDAHTTIIPSPTTAIGWFAKPYCVLNALFRPEVTRALWLDVDIQTMRPFAQALERYANGVWAQRDIPNNFTPPLEVASAINAGVMLFNDQQDVRRLIAEWISIMNDDNFRSDQEAFNRMLVTSKQPCFQYFPNSVQWLRIEGEKAMRRETLFRHFTGNAGKAIIKKEFGV